MHDSHATTHRRLQATDSGYCLFRSSMSLNSIIVTIADIAVLGRQIITWCLADRQTGAEKVKKISVAGGGGGREEEETEHF